MRFIILLIGFVFSIHIFAAELNPAKNGASELLEKSIAILPESRKHEKITLAFLTDEVNGKEASQTVYEMLQSGSFKGILTIGGADPAIADKLVRTVTGSLNGNLKGVTLIIAGIASTPINVEEKLKSLGAEVYFIR